MLYWYKFSYSFYFNLIIPLNPKYLQDWLFVTFVQFRLSKRPEGKYSDVVYELISEGTIDTELLRFE